MIPRYEIPEIAHIWSVENRFKIFLEVEIALLKALEVEGIIPKGTASAFTNVKIRPDRIEEIEKTTRHDIIAFTTSITEQVNPKIARFFHFGATSSDILDTTLSIQVKESLKIILQDLKSLLEVLREKVEATEDILSMGRSHGMYAEPMIFGQKFLLAYEEFKNRLNDYEQILETELTGKLSGAVGNFTILSPSIESSAMGYLGLPVEKVTSQIVPRHRLAKVISVGSLTAASLERLAVELRLLQHSDINEVQEGFSIGQKGSSTMPHKKNPISSENITGMSRIIRSHLDVALDNCVLWHERDISHSSTERLYLPDHFGLLSYSLRRMTSTVKNLVVMKEKIESKVLQSYSVLSSYYLHQMILLNEVTREEIYSIIQETSFNAKNAEEFHLKIMQLAKDKSLKTPKPIDPMDLKHHYQGKFKEVKERVFNL